MRKLLILTTVSVLFLNAGSSIAATKEFKYAPGIVQKINPISNWTSVLYAGKAEIIKRTDGRYLLMIKLSDVKETYQFSASPDRLIRPTNVKNMVASFGQEDTQRGHSFPPHLPNGLLSARGLNPTVVTYLGVTIETDKVLYMVKPLQGKAWVSKPLLVNDVVLAY